MTILWSSPSRCDSCDGRITHELLVSLTTSPSTGAATAMAALRGKGCSVLAANTAQAASSPTCALVLSVIGGPSFSTRPAATMATAQRRSEEHQSELQSLMRTSYAVI